MRDAAGFDDYCEGQCPVCGYADRDCTCPPEEQDDDREDDIELDAEVEEEPESEPPVPMCGKCKHPEGDCRCCMECSEHPCICCKKCHSLKCVCCTKCGGPQCYCIYDQGPAGDDQPEMLTPADIVEEQPSPVRSGRWRWLRSLVGLR